LQVLKSSRILGDLTSAAATEVVDRGDSIVIVARCRSIDGGLRLRDRRTPIAEFILLQDLCDRRGTIRQVGADLFRRRRRLPATSRRSVRLREMKVPAGVCFAPIWASRHQAGEETPNPQESK